MKKYTPHTLLLLSVFLLIFIFGCILHFERGTYYYSGDFQHISGSDDAYIAYRYSWNLIHYHILRWNETGFRRTEGFTNPLWVLFGAFWSLLGNKDLVYSGMVLTSILMMSGFLWVEGQLVYRKVKSTKGLLGILLLCASPVIWLHATSGLEAGVFGTGSGLLAYYTISEDQPSKLGIWLANALAFFLVVLRSDSFVYLLILLIGLILSRSRNWKLVLYGGVIGTVALLTWRELSFGQLTPNTAIAKLNFGIIARIPTGLVLLSHALLSGGILILLVGLFGILSTPKPNQISAIIILGGWIAYYVYIGGDLFLERHLIGVLVLSAGLSQSFFVHILQYKRGYVLISALLIGILAPLYTGDPRFAYLRGKPQDSWILLGKEIALQREQYGTIVTTAAGKTPFYAGGDFVDEFGLNDPDLSKVKRPKFIAGHSAGNHELGVEIAKQLSPTYSYFASGLDLTLDNANDVLLWVNNQSPDSVHYGLSDEQRDTILHANPFTYTLIIRGK